MRQAFGAHLHEQWRDTASGLTPGAVVRVSGPAGPLFDFAAGNERADRDTAMSTDSAFHVASVGKAMTATLVLQLIEAGRLDWSQLDRPIAEIAELTDLVAHIPVLRLEGVTLRRLMNHTSGLRDAFSDDGDLTAAQNGGRPAPRSLSAHLRAAEGGAGRWRAWNLDRTDDPLAGVINWFIWGGLAAAKPVFEPGSAFHYSDTAYMVLAILSERLSGQPYDEQLKARIFDPLGMEATYLAYAPSAPADWRSSVSDFLYAGRPAFSGGIDVSWDWGGGGQVSTCADLDRFLRGLFGGQLFSERETLDRMTDFITPPGLPEGCTGMGLGVRRLASPGGVELWGHAGAWSVQAFYAPAQDATITGTFNLPMATRPWLRSWVFDAADALTD
jgi:D-alanyl-D-alanine carboxypeptidase